ncbi:MAG: hypothetical protein HZB40_04730 [Rhodocyclales bacterium]|nr:hypothetical protein [Rhodocyclales bacterium]
MPTVTVNISDRGTALAEGGSSDVGHMWFEINAGDGTPPESFGFAPTSHGTAFGEGSVYTTDSGNYQSTVYSKTVEITEAQYVQLRDFGVNPAENGFSTYYNGLANSCIDFTWKALSLVGIDSSGFQGSVWPAWNVSRVDTVLQQFANGGIGATSPPPSSLRTFSTLDAQGRVVESSVQNGSGRTLYKKEYIYDPDGQGFTVSESVTVNGQNRVAKEIQYQTDPNGTSVQLATKYYEIGQPGQKLIDQQTVTYQPDGSVAMVRQDGKGHVYQIDTQTVDGSGTTTRTTTKYDKDSNWTDQTTTVQSADSSSTATTVTPEGASTTVTKDKNGQTTQVETSVPNSQGGRTKEKYEFTPDGQAKKKTTTKTDADGNTQTSTENYLPDSMQEANDNLDTPSAPQVYHDPLALDLNGDGLATTNAATNGIHFDHDNNGFAEATGWLNPADAYLAVDRNGNDTIDSGLELFGDQTLLRSGAKAASGLQALAEWDSNRDGQITAADTRFTDLRVWQDLNQDGISQSTELQTLTEAGIASIQLAGTATNAPADANGNTVTRTSSFIRTDGISGLAGEVTFKRDTALSIPVATYTVTDAIAAQPDLSGYGTTRRFATPPSTRCSIPGPTPPASLPPHAAAPWTRARSPSSKPPSAKASATPTATPPCNGA